MKHRWFGFFAVLGFCLALAACNNGGSSSSTSSMDANPDTSQLPGTYDLVSFSLVSSSLVSTAQSGWTGTLVVDTNLNLTATECFNGNCGTSQFPLSDVSTWEYKDGEFTYTINTPNGAGFVSTSWKKVGPP